jgi:prepilin-type N-terminal cleavage/methylation domain-containing protein
MALRDRENAGFTLMEIMIVVAIIGLLTAIIYPAYFNARDRSITSSCLNTLRKITDAKEQYALDHNNAAPDLPDLAPTYIQRMPVCPGGGNYVIGALGEDAECNIPAHTL